MARFVENAPRQVLAAAKELLEKGLVEGTAGNISARQEDGNIVITPSSLDYREMTLEDLVVISPGGEVVSGDRSPSSEKLLHLACLAAFDDIASCHPLPRRARLDVRRGPAAHPGVHRRVLRLRRRRRALHRVRHERHRRAGRAGGQGPARAGEPP